MMSMREDDPTWTNRDEPRFGPDLREVLAGADGRSPADLADLACADLIARWRRGQRIPAEAYMAMHPALNVGGEDAFDLIYGEYAVRAELGPAPSMEEFAWRFPGHAEKMRDQIALDRALDSISPPFIEGATGHGDQVSTLVESEGPPSPDWPELPGYRLRSVLGRGGMGVVYKAQQEGLEREVAIKTIATNGGPQASARFLTEAQAIAKIRHANVVQVYSIGDHKGVPYLVMEYVRGGNLASRLDGSPRPASQAAALVEALARGVHEAHRQGIVHRDLKPSNVLIADEGTPKVADFGLAKLLEHDSGLTRTETILGSPSYMAPEQADAKNREVGPAADVYALGAILYELLTGRPPFRGATILQTLEAVRTTEPVPPSRLAVRVPRDLETICLKCLAKEPGKRYGDALALADDLERFGAGRPIQARRASRTERAWKWARRHPDAAIPSLAFALALIAGVAGVVWKWRDAEGQRQASQRLSAGLTLDRGEEIARRGEVAEGLFWMLEALRAAPSGADDLDRNARSNLGAWADQAPALIGIVGASSPIKTAALSPEGRWMLVGTRGRRVRMLAVATGGDRFPALEIPVEIDRVAFRPDGRVFLVSCGGGAQLHDAETGKRIGPEMTHAGRWLDAAFTADGGRIATVADGPDVRFWNAADGRPLGPTLAGDIAGRTAQGVAFNAEGSRLAVVWGTSGRVDLPVFVRLYDTATGQPDGPILPHDANVTALAVSPDGAWILTACHDGRARLWKVGTEPRVASVLEHPAAVSWAAFTPDGQAILTSCEDGRARLWDLATGRELGGIPRQEAGLAVSALAADGRTLLLISREGEMRVWRLPLLPLLPLGDVPRGEPDLAFRGPRPPTRSEGIVPVAFSPDRRAVLFGTRGAGYARVVDPGSGEPAGPVLRHRWPNILAVAYSPDGARLVTAAQDARTVGGSIALRDAETGAVIAWLGSSNWIHSVAFSPGGRVLATGGYSGMVRLWDARTGTQIGPAMRQGAIVGNLAFGPSGATVIVATYPGNSREAGIRTWSVADGRPETDFLPVGQLMAVAPDGQVGLAVKADRPALIDLRSGEAIGRLLGRGYDTAVAEFRPDGRAVVTGSREGVVRLWDARTGEPMGTPMRLGEAVTALAFSPDGRLVLAGGQKGTVQLWDAADGRAVGPPVGHRVRILGLAFRPDGRSFVTAAGDGDARAWPVPQPVPGAPSAIDLRLQVRTGLEMLDSRSLAPLAAGDWLAKSGRAPSSSEVASDRLTAWHDRRARDAVGCGDRVAALWHLDRLAGTPLGDWTLPARRAWVLALSGSNDAATEQRAKAMSLGPADAVLDWCVQRAADLGLAGRPDDALAFLAPALTDRPDDPRALLEREILAGNSAPDDALLASRSDAEGLLMLAARHADRGGWAEAAALYARASRLASLTLQDRSRLAFAALAAGDSEGYRTACRQYVAWAGSEPDEPAALDEAAWACALGPAGLDDYAPLIARARAALKALPPAKTPRRAAASGGVGALLYRAGQLAGAVEFLKDGPTGDEDHATACAVFLAMARRRLAQGKADSVPDDLPAAPSAIREDPTWDRVEDRLVLDEARRSSP